MATPYRSPEEIAAAEDAATAVQYAAATQDIAIPSSKSHRTMLPPGFITVRIMQFILAAALVGLFAFTVSLHDDFDDFTWEAGIGLGTSVYTVVILIWIIAATYFVPKLYNYWAILAFEIVSFLAWVDCMIWSMVLAYGTDYDDEPYSCGESFDPDTETYTEIPCETVAPPANYLALDTTGPIIAAFTGALIILWFVSLVVVSVFISRHRLAGGHNVIGSPAPVYLDPSTIQRQYHDLEKVNLDIRARCLALEKENFDLQQQQRGLLADASQPHVDDGMSAHGSAPGRSAVV